MIFQGPVRKNAHLMLAKSRWCKLRLQQGVIPIPNSLSTLRLKFGFDLNEGFAAELHFQPKSSQEDHTYVLSSFISRRFCSLYPCHRESPCALGAMKRRWQRWQKTKRRRGLPEKELPGDAIRLERLTGCCVPVRTRNVATECMRAGLFRLSEFPTCASGQTHLYLIYILSIFYPISYPISYLFFFYILSHFLI
jgi:hypothetical protein